MFGPNLAGKEMHWSVGALFGAAILGVGVVLPALMLFFASEAKGASFPLTCHDTKVEALIPVPAGYMEMGNGADYHNNRFHLYANDATGEFFIALTMVRSGAFCFLVRGDNFHTYAMDDPEAEINDYDEPYAVIGGGSVPNTSYELEIHVQKSSARRFYIVLYDERSNTPMVIGLMWNYGATVEDTYDPLNRKGSI